jgi:hypothetical protein
MFPQVGRSGYSIKKLARRPVHVPGRIALQVLERSFFICLPLMSAYSLRAAGLVPRSGRRHPHAGCASVSLSMSLRRSR